jgi:hypothetical protein
MLSIRPEHGHFTLYYALPSLLPVLIWLAVFVSRLKTSRASAIEKTILIVFPLALTAPAQALMATPQQRWDVAEQALTRPIVNIAAMRELVLWVRASFAQPAAGRDQKQCASMGIAALIPDDLRPEEVIDPTSDISTCRTVSLLRHDMHYAALAVKVEASGFKRIATREHAEVWMLDGR